MSLPCLDPATYRVSPETHYKRKCIAQTAKFKQCSIPIRVDEALEVQALTAELNTCTVLEKRNKLLRRLILLRCCGRSHRKKLEAIPAALDKILQRYSTLLADISDILAPGEEFPDEASISFISEDATWYHLPPRTPDNEVADPEDVDDPHAFTPYPPEQEDDIRAVLRSEITMSPKSSRCKGMVYAFSCLEHPGLVKIGYTTRTVEGRLNSWLACYPDAKEFHRVHVPYAERTERLLHLEWRQQRREVVNCRKCGRGHIEWFRVSEAEVIASMDAWKELMVTQELYVHDSPGKSEGSLSPSWRKKLDALEDCRHDRTRPKRRSRADRDPTARMLLGTLRNEKRLADEARRKAEALVSGDLNSKSTSEETRNETTTIISVTKRSSLKGPIVDITWDCDWDATLFYFRKFWKIV